MSLDGSVTPMGLGEALCLQRPWNERDDARELCMQGPVAGHERSDGRAGPACLRGGQRRAHVGPRQRQERL